MADDINDNQKAEAPITHLARTILVTFLFTFVLSRAIVLLIMWDILPDIYLFVRGTHIHHLNYGIFLLSAVGAYLLFNRPDGKHLKIAAGVYGIALALTFDEFGMWLNLGGSYWQRASWDAIVVLSAVFALIAFAPSLRRFRTHHWVTTCLLIIALAIFLFLFIQSFKYAGKRLGPKLYKLESSAPR